MGREFDAGNLVAHAQVDMSGAINSIEELKRVIDQLKKATSGVNFTSVWGDAETALNRAKSAMQAFNKEQSRINATNVIKFSNALEAIDPSLYAKNFGSLVNELERAKELAPDAAKAFNTVDMRAAFEVYEKIKSVGGDVSSIFDKLSASPSKAAIRVQELNDQLAETQAKLLKTQSELESWQAGAGIENMKAQLQAADAQAKSLTETLEMTRTTAASEFSTWLQANNLDPSSWGQFSHLFEAIREGSITANDAITNVKSNYGYLLEEFAQTNGALPSGAFDTLTSKLDEISAKMAELGSGGAGTNAVRELASGLSESANITEQERVALAGLAQTANGDLPSVVQVIEALFSSIQQLGPSTDTAKTSVTGFISELRQLSGEGVESLSALSDMFTSLARNRDLSIGSLKGLTDFVSAVGGNEFANIGNLTYLSSVDLSKFSELKVSKAALSNLATFLPQIANVNIDALSSLANIDWSKLSNIKVDKSSISAIADMANMNESLGRMEAAFTGLGSQLTEISSKFHEMKEAAESGPKDTFGRSFNVKSATTEVNKFANNISELKVQMSSLGASGANIDTLSKYLSDADRYVKSFRENLNETGGVINKDLGKSSLDGLRESMANANTEAQKIKATMSALESVGKQMTSLENKGVSKTVLGDTESFVEYKNKISEASKAYEELKAKVANGLDLGTETGQNELKELKDKIKEAEDAYTKGVEAMNSKKLDTKANTDAAKEETKAIKDAAKAFTDMQKAQTLDAKITNILAQQTTGVNQYRSALEQVQTSLRAAIATGDNAKIGDAFQRASAQVANLQEQIKGVDAETVNLGTALKNLLGSTTLGRIGTMALARGAIYIRQVAKEMVSSAVDIESSLAQLQVITGASGSQLNTFFSEGAAAAREYGTEVASMLDSVTTFSRLGLIA